MVRQAQAAARELISEWIAPDPHGLSPIDRWGTDSWHDAFTRVGFIAARVTETPLGHNIAVRVGTRYPTLTHLHRVQPVGAEPKWSWWVEQDWADQHLQLMTLMGHTGLEVIYAESLALVYATIKHARVDNEGHVIEGGTEAIGPHSNTCSTGWGRAPRGPSDEGLRVLPIALPGFFPQCHQEGARGRSNGLPLSPAGETAYPRPNDNTTNHREKGREDDG